MIICSLQKPGIYLAEDERRGQFGWRPAEHAHRFADRGEAMRILNELGLEGIIEEVPKDRDAERVPFAFRSPRSRCYSMSIKPDSHALAAGA